MENQNTQDPQVRTDIAKENNLSVLQLGPFGRSGGTIEGLDTPAVAEDLRAEVTGLDTGATSELITSSTDNDVTDHEVAFIVKLKGKQPVSKETFNEEFSDYLESQRRMAAGSAYTDWLNENRQKIIKLRSELDRDLVELGFHTVPSQANFIWCQHPNPPALSLYEQLKRNHILVRYMDYPNWGDGLRISVGTANQNSALKTILGSIID